MKKAARKSDQDPADAMLQKVRSVYDILISNNYTYVQKNEALKQIIDKIIYDRKNDSLKIYFSYTGKVHANPVKSRACVYFIGYNNLVDTMGIQIIRRSGLLPYRNPTLLLW